MATKGKYRNTQTQLIEHLTLFPCQTEKELVRGLWGSRERDKKHADLLRRALHKGKINRVRVKFENKDTRKVYYYFVPSITE